jgi:hypothetical protein
MSNQISIINYHPFQFNYLNSCPAYSLKALLPAHLSNYAEIGHVYNVDGMTMCKYCDDNTLSQAFCEKAIEHLRAYLDKNKMLGEIDNLPLSPIHASGYTIKVQPEKENPPSGVKATKLSEEGYQPESECLSFRVRIDPAEKRNIVDALAFANREMATAFSNEASLESFLIALNRHLTNGMEPVSEKRTNYRTDRLFVWRENPDQLLESNDDFKEKTIQKIKNRLSKNDFSKLITGSFSPNERIQFNKKLEGLVFLPYFPEEIAHGMKQFAKELCSQLKQPTKSPHELASWAHVRYTTIHPHGDCNGKGARILFNMLLARFGLNTLVFPSDEEYTNALQKENNSPGSFWQYVMEKVIPWNDRNQHTLNP